MGSKVVGIKYCLRFKKRMNLLAMWMKSLCGRSSVINHHDDSSICYCRLCFIKISNLLNEKRNTSRMPF